MGGFKQFLLAKSEKKTLSAALMIYGNCFLHKKIMKIISSLTNKLGTHKYTIRPRRRQWPASRSEDIIPVKLLTQVITSIYKQLSNKTKVLMVHTFYSWKAIYLSLLGLLDNSLFLETFEKQTYPYIVTLCVCLSLRCQLFEVFFYGF